MLLKKCEFRLVVHHAEIICLEDFVEDVLPGYLTAIVARGRA